MDSERFDRITRTLGSGQSRRGLLKGLTGTAIGGLLASVGIGGTVAKPADKPSKCYGENSSCTNGKQCCSGTCANRRCAPLVPVVPATLTYTFGTPSEGSVPSLITGSGLMNGTTITWSGLYPDGDYAEANSWSNPYDPFGVLVSDGNIAIDFWDACSTFSDTAFIAFRVTATAADGTPISVTVDNPC